MPPSNCTTLDIVERYEDMNAKLDEMTTVLRYCPDTGYFYWLVKNKRRRAGEVAGCVYVDKRGLKYIRLRYKGRGYYAHRVAFHFMGQEIPDCVDHLNGDGLDNRWSNIRSATFSQNSKNKKMPSNNKSGVVGVCEEKGKWRAYVHINKKQIKLGVFNSLEDAAAARKRAEKGNEYTLRNGTDYSATEAKIRIK